MVRAGTSAGTCFVVSLGYSRDKSKVGVMFGTAWHVLEGVVGTGDEIYLVSADKGIRFNSKAQNIGFWRLGAELFDTAVISLLTEEPFLEPSDLLPILPFDSMMARGAAVGWVGFPGLVEPELCFFHGHISGYLHDPPTYLVDGVATNGVSGGPAFDDRAHLIGLVSAYIPNRVDSRTTLPGLMTVVPINAIRYWLEHNMQARVL